MWIQTTATFAIANLEKFCLWKIGETLDKIGKPENFGEVHFFSWFSPVESKHEKNFIFILYYRQLLSGGNRPLEIRIEKYLLENVPYETCFFLILKTQWFIYYLDSVVPTNYYANKVELIHRTQINNDFSSPMNKYYCIIKKRRALEIPLMFSQN